MANPLVSVVMPVRNGGVFLQSAIDSILTQNFRDFELLVVDDHSTDGKVAALEFLDPRLRIIRCSGRGVVNAFRTGMEQARGIYIARMDADDIALSQRLGRQVQFLQERREIDIAGACVRFFSADPIEAGNRHYQAWLNSVRTPDEIHTQLFIESPIPNPTAMFRTAAIRQLEGYRACGWAEDYDLFLRADRAGMRMGKPDQVLLEWRDHPGRLTHTDDLYSHERFQRAKAHYLAHGRLSQRELIIWGAGKTGRRMYDLLLGEGVEASGFIEVHPRRIGGSKRGKPVFGIERAATSDQFVLVAVGARGAREEIRAFMQGKGRTEGDHYLFVA